MLRAGKLPAVKVGREWRFPRDKIKALVFKQEQEEQPIELVARSSGGFIDQMENLLQ